MNEKKLKIFLRKWLYPENELAIEQFDKELNEVFEWARK